MVCLRMESFLSTSSNEFVRFTLTLIAAPSWSTAVLGWVGQEPSLSWTAYWREWRQKGILISLSSSSNSEHSESSWFRLRWGFHITGWLTSISPPTGPVQLHPRCPEWADLVWRYRDHCCQRKDCNQPTQQNQRRRNWLQQTVQCEEKLFTITYILYNVCNISDSWPDVSHM